MPIKPENKKLYPNNWREISYYIRVVRAKNKCEVCGAINYSHVDKITRELCLSDEYNAIKIILTVAHLDHDPTNNDELNLMAMCQRCHNRWDIPHRKKTRREGRLKGQLCFF